MYVIQLSDGYEWFEYHRCDTEDESIQMWDEFLRQINAEEIAADEMRLLHNGAILRHWQ